MIYYLILVSAFSFQSKIDSYRSLPKAQFVDSLMVLEQHTELRNFPDTTAYIQYLIGRYSYTIEKHDQSIDYARRAIRSYKSYNYTGYRLLNSHNDILMSAVALDSTILVHDIFQKGNSLKIDESGYRSKSYFIKNYSDYLISIGDFHTAIIVLKSYLDSDDFVNAPYWLQAWGYFSIANCYAYYENNTLRLKQGLQYLELSEKMNKLSLMQDDYFDHSLQEVQLYTKSILNLYLANYEESIEYHKEHIALLRDSVSILESKNALAYCLLRDNQLSQASQMLEEIINHNYFDSLSNQLRNKVYSNTALSKWNDPGQFAEEYIHKSIQVLWPSFENSDKLSEVNLYEIESLSDVVISLRNLARLYREQSSLEKSQNIVFITESVIDQFFKEQLSSSSVLNWLSVVGEVYDIGIENSYDLSDEYAAYKYLEKSKNTSLLYELKQEGATKYAFSLNDVLIMNPITLREELTSSDQIFSTKSIDQNIFIQSICSDKLVTQKNSALAKMLSGKRTSITIIPDAFTANISFGALPQDSSDTTSFLERDYTISYQLSATLMQELEDKQVNSSGVSIIAPIFDQDPSDIYASVRGYRGDSIKLYHLPYTEEEVGSISTCLGDVDITYEKASLIDAIEHKRILHFAGHGVTFPDDSDNSFLALGSDIDDPTQKLTLRELYDLKSNNELVVLSACSTAKGEIAEGEGVLSLARGFFYAGAKSVVSTLWAVNDQSSAIIMAEFYRQLKKGKRKDVALQQAKLHYLDSVDPEYQDPKYWAAFIVMGDMSPLFTPWWHYLSYGILGLVIMMMFYLIGKRFLKTT